jgi:hypothetical protein
VESTTDIFEFFRNLNVFKRNKKRFELKVVAVLLYTFGASGRPLASLGALRVSKSSVQDWVNKVEASRRSQAGTL